MGRFHPRVGEIVENQLNSTRPREKRTADAENASPHRKGAAFWARSKTATPQMENGDARTSIFGGWGILLSFGQRSVAAKAVLK